MGVGASAQRVEGRKSTLWIRVAALTVDYRPITSPLADIHPQLAVFVEQYNKIYNNRFRKYYANVVWVSNFHIFNEVVNDFNLYLLQRKILLYAYLHLIDTDINSNNCLIDMDVINVSFIQRSNVKQLKFIITTILFSFQQFHTRCISISKLLERFIVCFADK